jgi:HK97 family phage major capsid protein
MFGIPVVQSNGVVADTFYCGAFNQAGTIHDRESVTVEMSDSDDDNFTKNLVTIRAERRVALTIERPTGIIGGDLTPA